MSSGLARVRRDVLEMVREQADFRELLWAITRRDLIVRYRNSLLGFGWAVCMPVLNMLVFTVIFTRVVRLETGVPYPLYAFAGLLPWHLFASALRMSATSLTSNPNLVTRVYFPREVLPFSAVLVALIDTVVASLVLVALMIHYDAGVSRALFFLPALLLVQLAFTAGLALAVAMANLFYTDVKHVFEVLVTVWMFATSVLYPIERVGGTVGAILALNPMTPVIDGYRAVLLRGELPGAAPFAWATVCAVVALTGAWVMFHRAEFRFAEEI